MINCEPIRCSTWEEIEYAFNSMALPRRGFDEDGLTRQAWIFRGHQVSSYRLEPSIEREAEGKRIQWATLEYDMLREFQIKARVHSNPTQLPSPTERLSWLAFMQHYGVPTRLLDFTYSPYVALYFSLRSPTMILRNEDSEVWAINEVALDHMAMDLSRKADEEVRRHSAPREQGPIRGRSVSSHPADVATELDIFRKDSVARTEAISNALSPDGPRRYFFENNGGVFLAPPPLENPRLSSQQGVFLFNAARNMTFENSLLKMMAAHKGQWCRRFQFAPDVLAQAEERLFQMNIHDLSLFPDMEGLARFVRQRARLTWG